MFLHTLWLAASLKQPAHTCRKRRLLPLSSPWHKQTPPARLVRILQCLIQHVSAGPRDRYCCCCSLPVSSCSSSCATSSSSSSWLLAAAPLSFAERRQQAATPLVSPGSGSSVGPACLVAAQESEMSIGSLQRRHHGGSFRAGGAGETAEMKRRWNYHGYPTPNWSFDAQAHAFRCVHNIRLLVSLVLLNWLF